MSNTDKELQYFDFSLEPGRSENGRKSQYAGQVCVSVITYYEGKGYINQTYRSLANQTFSHWEWIIVTKNIDEDLKKLSKLDKRIKIITIDEERIAKAQYIAAEQAKSELILLLSEEDLIDKTMLECGYFTMLTNPEGVWTYSRMVNFGNSNNLYNKKLAIYEMANKNIISKCAFIRKDKFLELREYMALPQEVHEDWYMWLYFLSKKYVPIKMDFYGYWHRKTSKEKALLIEESSEKSKIAKEYIDKLRDEIKIDTNTIEFDKVYQIDYKDIPQKIEISKKDIFQENEKKRILFIVPWFVVGGADIFTLNLIKGLRNNGYEISVVTTKKCDYILRQKVEQFVDEYFDLTTFLKEKDWASFIYHIIKSRKIQCVFITNTFFGYYVLPWLKYYFKEIPFVDYIHAENWTLRNGGFPKDSNSVAGYLDTTFTCTKHLKEMMYTIMNRNVKNIKPVYIGTDVDFYNRDIEFEGEKELKEKYKNKKVILLVGRMVHYKRPLFALKVLQELLKQRDDIRLAIVGDGIALDDVRESVKANNLEEYVDIYGMQEDVRRFYKVADVTLVCSLREGLTLTTYESLSMGVPVVSSDIGGQKELIQEDCGYLIRPYQLPEEQFDFNYSEEEIDEFSQAILKILNNDKEEYIQKCREKIVNNFSIDKMIIDIDKSITKLIKNGSSVDKNYCNNIEFAERYLLVNSMLENLNKTLEEKNKENK